MSTKRTALVIGYGNPGRCDDGLGPALAEAIEQMAIADVTVDSQYQLVVEDAAEIARHAVVIFADASVAGPEPFSFEPLAPVSTGISFSSHSLQPAAVLGLAHQMFDAQVSAYLLGIRGYEFNEFRESLSGKAQANLAAAVSFLAEFLRRNMPTGETATKGADHEGRKARCSVCR